MVCGLFGYFKWYGATDTSELLVRLELSSLEMFAVVAFEPSAGAVDVELIVVVVRCGRAGALVLVRVLACVEACEIGIAVDHAAAIAVAKFDRVHIFELLVCRALAELEN